MALLPGAALGAVVSFEILSTSGSNLSATFEFSGSLDTDGTFNFDSSGNPLTNPSFSVSYVASTNYALSSSGSLSGSFTMAGTLSDGTNDFSSNGSPLSSPSFTSDFDSFSNQPNQNDDYIVTGGEVAALKYDLFNNQSLNLRADGTYTVWSDQTITVAEGELYRAIAVTLDCPLPPLGAIPTREQG